MTAAETVGVVSQGEGKVGGVGGGREAGWAAVYTLLRRCSVPVQLCGPCGLSPTLPEASSGLYSHSSQEKTEVEVK